MNRSSISGLPEFNILFIPSPQDFSEYRGNNSYSCGLELIRAEVLEIISKLSVHFNNLESIEDKKTVPRLYEKDSHFARNSPELFIEIGMALTSGTVTSLFINSITNWVNTRNGRKLRIRLKNGFEFEASQLTKDEFLEVFSELYEKYGTDEPLKKGDSHIIFLNDTEKKMVDFASEDITLNKAYSKKMRELLNKK